MVHSRRCAFPVSWAQAKKTRRGLNSLSYFHAHEKTVHSLRCTFPVSWAQAKKTRRGLNLLSYFHPHEKMVHWTIFLIFVYEW